MFLGLQSLGLGAKGVLAGLGTPSDPKPHLFGTTWVAAIQPFWISLAGLDAEFRPRARQIGSTPSISVFFDLFRTPKSGNVQLLNICLMFFCRRPPWRA